MKSNQLKIGIILNYLNMGLGNLIPIFYTPIMLALLGQSEYGLYKLSSSVTSYLSLISLGLGSAIARYLIKARIEEGKEAEEKMLGFFVTIFRGVAVITLVIGIILIINLDIWYLDSLSVDQLARMKLLVFIMVINMAVGFVQAPYISVVNAYERFVFLQCMNILTTCVIPVVNLVVLFWGYGSIGMVTCSLVISTISRYIYCLYTKKYMDIKPRYTRIPMELLKEIFIFSFWIFVSNVGSQLCNATDIAMIGAIPRLATKGVAVYNIGATFNTILCSLTTGVSAMLVPRANKMVFSGVKINELTDVTISVGRIQTYIVSLIVFGFISFGQPFLRFYAGVGYEESYYVALLMMIPSTIPLIQSMCLSIIVALNKHKFRSLVCVGITVGNVIGTWFLLQFGGVSMAALMTGITLLLGNGIILNLYYWKKIGLNIPKFWKNTSVIFIIPFFMSIITVFVSNYVDFYKIHNLVLGILIFTVLYFGLSWKFIMNVYEKNIIWSPIRKIIDRIRR